MKPRPGFTLIEIIIAFAILAILMIMGFGSWRTQIDKARDADRKSDLQRLKTAFEDYFNDHECYPPLGTLSASDGLKPYLDKIPRDPITKQPYQHQFIDCRSYRILTHLDNETDPIINSLGCNPNCGYGSNLNYGITSSNLNVSNTAD